MNPYDYKNNIVVTRNKKGNVNIQMNEQIFTTIRNLLYDASKYHEEKGRNAISKDTMDLWYTLISEDVKGRENG